MKLLNAQHLSIGYEGKKIVSHINFTIEESDYVVIIGENGSGKTTLIKTVLGLLKPLSGKITFQLKKNKIGYLSQLKEINKDFPASVYEVVISGCLNHKRILSFYHKKDKELAELNLKKFKIEHLKSKSFSELSGGEQQRVLLARAMCASSQVLILDEPTLSLDKRSSNDLYRLIEKLHQENITIIMISHDLEEAIKYANKVIEIKDHKFFMKTKEQYVNEVRTSGCNHF